MTQLSYLLNTCFPHKQLHFLVFSTTAEVDFKLAQKLKQHILWIVLSKPWDYSKYIPRENMIFIDNLDSINVNYIIADDPNINILKSLTYIPILKRNDVYENSFSKT